MDFMCNCVNKWVNVFHFNVQYMQQKKGNEISLDHLQ